MQPTPMHPDGAPYRLNTVAVSLPGTATRVLIDMVSPDEDPRGFALHTLSLICKTPPHRWVVQVVAQPEFQDVTPGGARLPQQAS